MPKIATENAEIYYETHGEAGPWIVFAHGLGGNSAVWWQQVPHFMARYRVLVFDHRCFGRSTCDFARHFSPRFFVADLMALLEAERIDRAAIVAQSMGGRTGLGMAIAHPERVSCLVMCDTTGALETPDTAKFRAATKTVPARIGKFITPALGPNFPRLHPELAHLYGQIMAFNTGVDYTAPSPFADPSVHIRPEQLAGYRTPTLVLAGSEDQIFSPAWLRHVAATIPGAAFTEVPGSGHSVYFEDAASFNAIVGEFLAKHALR